MEPRRIRTAARGEQDQRTVGGDATRKRILKAAERLFAKSGIDAVSIRDITDAAGVNTRGHPLPLRFQERARSRRCSRAGRASSSSVAARMLDRIEAQPKVALRDVVEVLVWPMIELGKARAGAVVAIWDSWPPS